LASSWAAPSAWATRRAARRERASSSLAFRPRHLVDQGQVGLEHGLLQRQPLEGGGRVVAADQAGHEPAGTGHVGGAGALVELGLDGGQLLLGGAAAAVSLAASASRSTPRA
jgi:hypothetical protein